MHRMLQNTFQVFATSAHQCVGFCCVLFVGKKQLKVSALLKHAKFDFPEDDEAPRQEKSRAKHSEELKSKKSELQVNSFRNALLLDVSLSKCSQHHYFLSEPFEGVGIDFDGVDFTCDIKLIFAAVDIQSTGNKYANPFYLAPKGSTGLNYPLRTYQHIEMTRQVLLPSSIHRNSGKYTS